MLLSIHGALEPHQNAKTAVIYRPAVSGTVRLLHVDQTIKSQIR